MKAKVRFIITSPDGGNGGRGTLLLAYSSMQQLRHEATERLRNTGVLKAGEGVRYEVLHYPSGCTSEQELATSAFLEGGYHAAI